MTTGIRRPMTALAVLVLLSPSTSALPADDPSKDAFADVDVAFRELYAQGRAATLEKLGPVIVVEMDKLILRHGGTRSESTVIPQNYHRLKSISHVPLALYVALAPFGDAPLPADRLAGLRTFSRRVAEVVASLEQSGLTPAQIERSRSLLRRCADFLDGVLKTGRYEPGELRALTKEAGPVVLSNAADAARAQIDAYHAQVSAWRRQMPEEQWAKLRVVILGPQMPRKHNVAVQYFAKLMGSTGESRRLVYAEELNGEQQALSLLATHRLDSELSEAFFGDPERMEIDLLGNAAAVYLDGFDFGR
jgi:hypothetical protein